MTTAGPYASEMERMLHDIDMEYAMTRGLTGQETMPERIREALLRVPRHRFVPSDLRHLAYDNHPLPIGSGQTISQPFIVALMSALLKPEQGNRVLEVGCGCGYQAAVLSLLVDEVYSAEIVPSLAESARERLQRLGYGNVTVENRNGYYGWSEQAPFDGIIVTAAAPEVPPALKEQLKRGGRLVLPVGPVHGFQRLVTIRKGADCICRAEDVLGVAFVPLSGIHHHGNEE